MQEVLKGEIKMKNVIFSLFFMAIVFGTSTALANPPGNVKSKFYNFGEQVIDGDIKTPAALYTDARQKVKFDRLLRLKKSFIPQLNQTSKERTFK